MNNEQHRELLARLSEALTQQRWDLLEQVYTPDVTTEYPQSAERFRGVASLRGQFENYPGGAGLQSEMSDVIGGSTYALTPMYTVVAVEGSGDRGTAIFRTRYPDGSYWWVITIYELVDGRIAKARVFFAPEFDAPEWRAPFWDRS
jgi:hypothetical protein